MAKSRRCLWLSVALLFLFSVTSFAEVCLTDQEFDELTLIVTTLDEQSIADGKELRMLKSNLSTARLELIDSKIATIDAAILSDALKISLQEQRRVTIAIAAISLVSGIMAGWLLPR